MIEFSVVIPVYNAENFVAEAIQSVRQQTISAGCIEVIVLDDGSTDGSAEVAREALDGAEAATQFVTLENGGPSRARNLGRQRAQGEWIQFLDADDRLHPRKLDVQAPAARSADREVAVIYSDFCTLVHDGSEWKAADRRRPEVGNDTPMEDLLGDTGFIQLGSALFRRQWLDEVSGFDDAYEPVEDVNLTLRLAQAGSRFQYVPSEEPLSAYRQMGDTSFSGRNPKRHTDAIVANARMAEAHWRDRDALTPSRRSLLTRIYFQGTRCYATEDQQDFHCLWNHLQTLNPDALPERPWTLRWLSRTVGYPCAERIAVWYRHLKETFSSLS